MFVVRFENFTILFKSYKKFGIWFHLKKHLKKFVLICYRAVLQKYDKKYSLTSSPRCIEAETLVQWILVINNTIIQIKKKKKLHSWKQTQKKCSSVSFYSTFDFLSTANVKTQFKIIFYRSMLTRRTFINFYTPVTPSILTIQPSCALTFYTLLFHSLFKAEFNIDHFVLGEHRER